ncbi:hypothetical protein O8J54_35260, partial [Pseudomonas aeruginosa]
IHDSDYVRCCACCRQGHQSFLLDGTSQEDLIANPGCGEGAVEQQENWSNSVPCAIHDLTV